VGLRYHSAARGFDPDGMLAGMERQRTKASTATTCWALAVAGALVGAAVLAINGRTLAFAGGEIYGHLWTWWWHGEALPSWPTGTDWASGTTTWPVIDPLTCAVGAVLSRLSSLPFAWNAVASLAVLGAGAGGAWLARRAGGNPWVGGVVLASAPIFLGSLLSGLSEDLALGLLAVVCGLSWVPSVEATRRRWIGLGLCLGVLAWCGLYVFWMGAWLAAFGALMDGRRLRSTARHWALSAGIALLIAGPVILSQGDRVRGEGHSYGAVDTSVQEPSWKVNPWHAVDLASLVVPGRADVPEGAIFRLHPAYLGLLPLLLASRGRGRRWWLLFGGAALAACGPEFRWFGAPTGVPNPVELLVGLLPGGTLIHHHGRLLLAGVLGLAVLAARGWSAWVERFPPLGRWRRGVAGVIVVELLILGPLPLNVSSVALSPRDFGVVSDGEDAGSLLAIPQAGPGVHPQRPLYDQTAHRYRVPVDPNRPGAPKGLHKSATGRWLAELGRSGSAPTLARFDWCALHQEDVGVLAVGVGVLSSVSSVLGLPDAEGADGAAWRVKARCVVGSASNGGASGELSGETLAPDRE